MTTISPEIDDAEALANFILERSKVRVDGIHWRAFLPNRKDGQRSVYRIDGLLNEYVAENGRAWVANLQNKKILGWGVIKAGAARSVEPLTVRSDPPPPRHAAIEGWPATPEEQEKLAMALAAEVAETVRWESQ